MKRSRLRFAAYVLGFLLLGFVVLQFIGPRVTNPPVVADLAAPDEVKAVLKTSCYNCHSNETHLWWYDKIAPASWIVARDVKRGRVHLNFSDFGQLSPAAQKAMLYESVNMMQLGYMPPQNYLFVHPEAKVTPEQVETLKKYLHPSDEVTPATPEATANADAQYQKWVSGVVSPEHEQMKTVQPAPNGLAFFPDYKNWKPVSFTDRFDNGTMRVILGNDVAQKAIAAGNVHPWPDGTAFAKIAYKQQPDASGSIWTGEFLQVEFMLKDAMKYKSTEGWGFGRWKTTELKPYGKNANFTTECASCHAPMQANDFVYTMPIHDAPGEAFNATAALPTDLPAPLSDWQVITTLYDHSKHTISVLYGNSGAVMRSKMSANPSIMPGVAMALVTWQEQDDKHWYGGRIPGKLQSVELTSVGRDPSDGSLFSGYKRYEGSPLKEQAPDTTTEGQAIVQQRVAFINGLRAAVMP